MDNPNDLKLLILHLSPVEKRYLRRYAKGVGGGKDKNYLRLYEFLEANPGWTDADIRTHFEGEAFLRQLPVAKHYLLHLILDALRAYDKGKSPLLAYSERIDKIDLLYRRKHYVIAGHQLALAQKQIRLLDLPAKELELLRWEMRLVRHKGGPEMLARLPELYSRERAALAQMETESGLLRLYDEMYMLLVSKAGAPAEILDGKRADLMASPLLGCDPASLSFESCILYHYVHAWDGYLRGDWMAYISAHKAMITLWDDRPARRQYEEERYFKTLLAYQDGCLQAGQLKDVPATTAKLRRLLKHDPALDRAEGFKVFHQELHYHLAMADYAHGRRMVDELVRAVEKAGSAVSPAALLSIQGNVALLWFCMEAWKECIDWLEQLLRSREGGARKDIAYMAKVLRLVAYYELGQLERVEQLLRSLTKGGVHTPLEAGALNFFVQLLASDDPTDERKAQQALAVLLDGLPETGPRLFLTELRAWLQARIHGTSVQEVMLRRTAVDG